MQRKPSTRSIRTALRAGISKTKKENNRQNFSANKRHETTKELRSTGKWFNGTKTETTSTHTKKKNRSH